MFVFQVTSHWRYCFGYGTFWLHEQNLFPW